MSEPQSWSGRYAEDNTFWTYRDLNCDLSVDQPVASHYTDCAIPAPGWDGMDWIDVAQDREPVEDCCERGNKSSSSIKYWEILEQLND
jgi:hypothetical protein